MEIEELRELITLVDQSSIAEFTYETDGTTVTLKKTQAQAETSAKVSPSGATEQPEAFVYKPQREEIPTTAPDNSIQTEKPDAEKTTDTDFDQEIVAPMVGTFYTRPEPESDPYVQKGTKVANDTVVCIVEAMKLFNEIEAEVNGEITDILVNDGELVEYGQPLFRVKTK